MAYVYFLKNKTTGLKYIGIRYAKNCKKEEFWVSYFTSSKIIKTLIELYGKEDFEYRIIREFECGYEALKYENKLNRLAVTKKDYCNLHYNFIGEQSKEQFTSVLDKQKKSASLYGKLSYLNKTGIHKFSKEEKKIFCKMGGYKAAAINRKLNRAIFDPEVRKKQHETLKREQKSAYYDPVLKKEICSKGGKAGPFSSSYYVKNGLSESDRINAQRERGKKGGPKNKGFKWYNDGKKSFKYTLKQQNEKDYDLFLKENNYFPGKLSNHKGLIWVNDGIKNYMIEEKFFDKTKFKPGRLGDRSKYNGHKNKKNNKD